MTDDIFVICNLKVTKNNRNTYHNMHFDKKLPKKYLVHISGYIPTTTLQMTSADSLVYTLTVSGGSLTQPLVSTQTFRRVTSP